MPDIGLGGTLNVRMVLTYSALAILVVSTNTLEVQSKAYINNGTSPIIKPKLDPKRRSELIEETFSEQKDMLLDMLETKLKEVRDKKKKQDRAENVNETDSKCESMPKNVDVVLKGHGISAIGGTDVRLRYGEHGNGTLSLDATGISNVGKVHVELGVADGNVHIPGLDNIVTGETLLKKGCSGDDKRRSEINNDTVIMSQKPDQIDLDNQQTRRVDRGQETRDIVPTIDEPSNDVEKSENNDVHVNNNTNGYNNNKSSPSILQNNTTVIHEEARNIPEVLNDTFTSNVT